MTSRAQALLTEALALGEDDRAGLLASLDESSSSSQAEIDRVWANGYDLWYHATTVGADLVVETWISQSPLASDTGFDPQPGDWVTVGDDEEPAINARVTRRDANKVWVQLELGLASAPTASHAVSRG